MVWKPKEKKLSAEEAVALAKKELAPYWFGSSPLLAGLRSGPKSTAHPLDPKIVQKTWLLLFIDATTFGGNSALQFLCEWYRRYSPHELNFMLILRFPYQNIYTRTAIEDILIQANDLQFPVAIDSDGSLGAAFGAIQFPTVICLKDGHTFFDYSGADCVPKGELHLQNFLRSLDPGLPLLPVMFSGDSNIPIQKIDTGSVEFGLKSTAKIETAAELPDSIADDRIVLTGNWTREAERILTKDPEATLSFRCPATRLALVARAQQKTIETGIIQVQINGLPAYEAFRGKQLIIDEESNTVLQISAGWLYETLIDLPETDRSITLRFPTANNVAVSIYGLRFGN